MQKIRILIDGHEPFEVGVTSRDLLFWERTVKGASMARLDAQRAVDLYSLAWSAAKRQGLLPDGIDLAAFEQAADVESSGAPARPTNPGA